MKIVSFTIIVCILLLFASAAVNIYERVVGPEVFGQTIQSILGSFSETENSLPDVGPTVWPEDERVEPLELEPLSG